MTHDLPVPTPEQTAFGDRLVAAMIPFLDDGMDMLHAERATAPIAAAAMLDDGADPDKVAALLFQALNRTNSGQLFRHDDVLVSENLYEDRKSGVSGKSASVRVDLGGRSIIKNKNQSRIHANTNLQTDYKKP